MKDKTDVWLFYWTLLAPDLAVPVPEFRFSSERKYRFDWAYPEQLVAVEVDGGQFAPGGGRHALDSDRAKLNLAASMGWRVFRFSPRQLEQDPAACLALVLKATGEQHGREPGD